MRILIIGQGFFGTYITENVIKPLGFEIVDILRSKDFNKIQHYAEHPELYDRIYIALPYQLHNPIIRMFPPNTHILCEKPVLGYESIPKVRIGYHRLYDRHFINAKLDIQKKLANGEKPRIRIISRDTDPSSDDSLHWLYVAMCHDLHMAEYLIDSVKVNDVIIGKNGADITVEMEGKGCRITIEYERDWKTYVQQVVVDNVVYGYDSELFSATYEETYRREFIEFMNDGKVQDYPEKLQHRTAQLLLDCARIICKKNENALDIHKKMYDDERWKSELVLKLLEGNTFALPFEPIEQK